MIAFRLPGVPMTRSFTFSLLSVCSVLLLLSSLEHLSNPFRFLDGVMAYKLISFRAARIVAAILPAISLVTGLSLLTKSLRMGGMFMTMVLGLVFAIVQGTALARDLTISCGCFDPFRSQEVSLSSLIFPIMLSLTALVALTLEIRHEALEQKTASAGNLSA